MIEHRTVHRARPQCPACGWVGDWRTSTSRDIASAKASRQLVQHEQEWHPRGDA